MATGASYRMPGTLPKQKSGFVGREAELARTRELLNRSRLVTVTGPGGVGKTRLAVAVGELLGDRYAAGTVFVPLEKALPSPITTRQRRLSVAPDSSAASVASEAARPACLSTRSK